MLKRDTAVPGREATVRRHPSAGGKAALVVQKTQKSPPSEAEAEPTGKLIVSPEGAMVCLLKGVWAEVQTGGVGKVEPAQSGESVPRTKLSSFSRRREVETFTQQATGEWPCRGVAQASEVCAVMDGAQWIDGFRDWQGKEALPMLDLAHAAEDGGTRGPLAQAAGTAFPQDWLAQQLHELTHQGPEAVLQQVSRLRDEHPDVEEISKKGTDLEKRKARMPSPPYQAAGWPSGSGMVESGNQVVMQARLKGAGLHWAPAHVNPLLALRTRACTDRWDQTNQQVPEHRACQPLAQRRSRQADRYARLLRQIQIALLLLAPPSKPQPPAPPRTASSPRSGPTRPSASHPWRKPFLAKK